MAGRSRHAAARRRLALRWRLWLPYLFVVLTLGAAAGAARASGAQVGEEVQLHLESSQPLNAPALPGPRRVSVHEIHHPGASYICPHFAELRLGEGDFLVVRSPDGQRSWTYRASDLVGRSDGFWAIHIGGDRAVIELFSAGAGASPAYVIDRYARGYRFSEKRDPNRFVCGCDDTQPAICYEMAERDIWNASKAVARLIIEGTRACTGWLLGNEGHILTNEHCIPDQATATNTSIEFGAQSETCEPSCTAFKSCGGTKIQGSVTLVKSNGGLDYSLLELQNNPVLNNGFLKLRKSGGVANERVYLPQHPMGGGKRIAVHATDTCDESTYVELTQTLQTALTTVWLYQADTDDGSSGGPVIGYSDHQVVALHSGTFGTCGLGGNGGTLAELIIQDLGADLPDSSVNFDVSVSLTGNGGGLVTSADGEIDCGLACEHPYGNGTTVTLTATEEADSVFSGWAGGGCSGTGTCVVEVGSDLVIEATFEPLCTLSIDTVGNCTVTSDPVGIDCGVACDETLVCGSPVTLDVMPDSDSVFVGWSGDADCLDGAVNVETDLSCTARCELKQHSLTVVSAGSGVGTVTSIPPGIDCGGDCDSTFAHGTVVDLSVEGDHGRWLEEAPCFDGRLEMTESRTCTIEFVDAADILRIDGFESGDCGAWSHVVGGCSNP